MAGICSELGATTSVELGSLDDASTELEAGIEEADDAIDVGLVTVEAAFAAVLFARCQPRLKHGTGNNVPGDGLSDFLRVTGIVPTDSLAYLYQLRLNIFFVEETKLGPDGAVQEDEGIVPRPKRGGNGSLGGEGRRCSVALLNIGLGKYVAR